MTALRWTCLDCCRRHWWWERYCQWCGWSRPPFTLRRKASDTGGSPDA